MSCASFVYFDSMYSYGSLALAILVIILLAGGTAMSEPRWRVTLLVMTPLLTALAITHHLTGFIAASLLSCLAALEWLGSGWSLATRWRLANAAIAAALVAGWSSFVGNPSEGYLVPVFQDAWVEAKDVMSLSGGRALFQSEDGMLMPAWQRYITLFSVALVCVGLAVGFLHALAWSDDNAGSHRVTAGWHPQWHNLLLVLLTGLTLLFPLCVLLKLTRAGWEVGNRISPFAYLGVGVVVAIGIAVVWLNSSRSISRVATVATACSLCILAGIISGGGPFALGNPRFRVSADSASVEPLGIGTAQWTADWLGPDHRFYADRTNRLLLATYGRQQVVTTLYDKIDLEPVMFAPDLNQAHLHALRETDVDYLALDRRLTLQLPVVGWYFDPGRVYHEPPHLAAFHKFTGIPGIDRVYDNGFVSIADVRKFRDGR